jgi:hypothetical protein
MHNPSLWLRAKLVCAETVGEHRVRPAVLAAVSGPSCTGRMLVLGFLDVYRQRTSEPRRRQFQRGGGPGLSPHARTAQETQEDELPLSFVEHHRLRLPPGW